MKCQACNGSGLADKIEMGNAASKLCESCKGSGSVTKKVKSKSKKKKKGGK